MCCSDNIHCCPNGYTCDTEGGRCNKGEATNVVLTKISVDEKTADDMCPDKNSSCPTGTTCCKMISGGYGCCAFPKVLLDCFVWLLDCYVWLHEHKILPFDIFHVKLSVSFFGIT